MFFKYLKADDIIATQICSVHVLRELMGLYPNGPTVRVMSDQTGITNFEITEDFVDSENDLCFGDYFGVYIFKARQFDLTDDKSDLCGKVYLLDD